MSETTALRAPNAQNVVALCGYGTVGEAVANTLLHEQGLLREKSGAVINLKYIIDRDPTSVHVKNKQIIVDREFSRALGDPQVSIVVELIGGVDDAYMLVSEALRAGKHVVTANKALLAEHAAELLAIARAHGVSVAYEASCGGGIPILRALYSGLISNRIDGIYAIINGTCNYILSNMVDKNLTYSDALKEAQERGYAEADPTLDIDGSDAAHKLALMTTLAFGKRICHQEIFRQGIENIDAIDLNFARQWGYTVKLIAAARRAEHGIVATVRPTFLEHTHPLGWVGGAFNAVSIYGNSTGHTLFYGQGAGGLPTASAVMADIIGIATGEIPTAFSHFANWPDRCDHEYVASTDDLESNFFIRLFAVNRPGTLSKITAILGKQGLNIASIHQDMTRPSAGNSGAPVMIILNRARERSVRSAVQELNTLSERCYYYPVDTQPTT